MTSPSLATDGLLEDIERIAELDDYRKTFAEWRKLGRNGLKQFTEVIANPSSPEAKRWQLQAPLRHAAQVVKTLCRRDGDPNAVKTILEHLAGMTPTAILGSPKKSPLFERQDQESEAERLRFLDAAYALDAVASAPARVFSPALMCFYYVVVRELYFPTPPVWLVGGARAGVGGRPTAFVTSQFVRGILSFVRMLERTAKFIAALKTLHTEPTGLADWDRQDAKRHALSLHVTLSRDSWNLAIPLQPGFPADGDIAKFEAALRHDLIKSLRKAERTFLRAYEAVESYRKREIATAHGDEKRAHLIDRSAAAHAVASRALHRAVLRATEARKLFPGKLPSRTKRLSPSERERFQEQLQQLERGFRGAAEAVRNVTLPALDYLSNVLDTQLALAASDPGGFEPTEMAAAAASLGAAGRKWDDERLVRAAKFLAGAMGREGFPIRQPFHTAGGVSFYQPSQQHIVGAYAQILEHVDAELSPAVLGRIARFFEETHEPIDKTKSGWRWVYAERKGPLSAYQTAISTIALDRLCRMLDQRINKLVLRHFASKQPTLQLHELFYPDYGLATHLAGQGSTRPPIALALERMRAHVAGVKLPPPYEERLYSVVFHGPPGTGKTTLLEALAASSEVPLVEVTPSDIVVHGTDAVEKRARAVLRALSFLTRAVVIFDEFDQVLQTREGQNGPASMLTFLTPNMLPKLKTLYEAAKDRQVAFALATNVLRKLDPAAIRAGRFDAIIGVYPPDLLSRAGRLTREVHRFLAASGEKVPAGFAGRFATAVAESREWSMQHIGRPGWFTRPSSASALRSETLFGFLFGKSANVPVLPRLSDAVKKRNRKPENDDLWSDEEREEWNRIAAVEEDGDAYGKAIRTQLAKVF